MKFLVFFFLFALGCQKLPVKFPSGTTIRYLSIQRGDAKKFVESQRTFLKAIFQETNLSEWTVPAWNSDCLTENVIGEVEEKGKAIYLVSTLHTSGRQVGLCTFDNKTMNYERVAFVSCSGHDYALEIHCPYEKCLLNNWSDLCP